MSKRNKGIIITGLIIVLLIVGSFFIYSFLHNGNVEDTGEGEGEKEAVEYSPEGEVPQEIEDPVVVDSGTAPQPNEGDEDTNTSTVDNSDLSATLKPSKEMESVIKKNEADLNNSNVISDVAPSYPKDVIPLFKADEVADSADITTNNGNPGWTCQYGSNAYVNDVADFYKSLLNSTTGYSDETNADTQKIAGTIDNCFVQITVSPNNPQKTGMNVQSDIEIFIERNS